MMTCRGRGAEGRFYKCHLMSTNHNTHFSEFTFIYSVGVFLLLLITWAVKCSAAMGGSFLLSPATLPRRISLTDTFLMLKPTLSPGRASGRDSWCISTDFTSVVRFGGANVTTIPGFRIPVSTRPTGTVPIPLRKEDAVCFQYTCLLALNCNSFTDELCFTIVVICVEVNISFMLCRPEQGAGLVSRMQIITWLLLQLHTLQNLWMGVAVVFMLANSFCTYIHCRN